MTRIMPVRLEEAKALSDELRIMILEMLKEKPMSVGEIVDELRRRGIFKTHNAIRYHIAILKDAGLIELVKTGNTLRYHARDHYYAYTGTAREVDERIDQIADEVADDVEKIVSKILKEHKSEIEKIAISLKPCEFCITKHFIEHVIYEIVRKATGKALTRLHSK
ncbi:MAG: helix-turn-helix domain-containing protein [Desulfurococcales archaeon]|nr:helix-turn-helix domain-containing protein [Desulfurococcales archaeon]